MNIYKQKYIDVLFHIYANLKQGLGQKGNYAIQRELHLIVDLLSMEQDSGNCVIEFAPDGTITKVTVTKEE